MEYTIFNQLRKSETAVKEGLLDDFTEIVGAVQFSNVTNYLGYRLLTNMGMRLTRKIDRWRDRDGQRVLCHDVRRSRLGYRRELEWRCTMRTFSFFLRSARRPSRSF